MIALLLLGATTSTAAPLLGFDTALRPATTATATLEPGDLKVSSATVASACRVVSTRGNMDLRLDGLAWSGWQTECEELVSYVRPGPPPYAAATARLVERLLVASSYFDEVHCEPRTARLECWVSPQAMIRDVEVSGQLPFTIFKDDLRRRVFLHPGALLDHPVEALTKQRERLEDYLRREGFIGSRVEIGVDSASGAEPNLGVHLKLSVTIGDTTRLRYLMVNGASPIPPEEIRKHLEHHLVLAWVLERFRPAQFEEDLIEIGELFRDRGWPAARVKGDYDFDLAKGAADVTLTIDPGPRVIVRFEGNLSISDDALLELARFKQTATVDGVEIQNLVGAIKRRYQEDGWFEARVESRAEHATGDTLILIYSVEEGRRAEVAEVVFEGAKSFAPGVINDEAHLVTKKSGVISSGRWVDERVARDQKAIAAFYKNRGFGQVKVTSALLVRPDGKLRATFKVEEGPKRKVGAMTIAGLPEGVDLKRLVRRLKLVTGAPWVEELQVVDQQEILGDLAAAGFARAKVDRKVGEGGDGAVLSYTVKPGPRTVLGGLLVRGNFRTAEGFVEDELSLTPGQPLDLLGVGRGKRRLRDLGIYSAVDLVPLDAFRGEAETWLLVALEEKELRTLDGLIAFTTDDLFAIGADYRDRNLFGRAVLFDLKARGGLVSDNPATPRIGHLDLLSAVARAPRPFGAPFDVEASLLGKLEDNAIQREQRLELGTGVLRALITRETCAGCPLLIAALRYRLSGAARVYKGEPPKGAIGTLTSTAWAPVGRIVPALTLDGRDSPVDPHNGYFADVRFELANRYLVPGGAGASFWRFLTSAQLYLELGTPLEFPLKGGKFIGGPFVAVAAATYDMAQTYDSSRLPAAESFDYGGDTSVRGIPLHASSQVVQGATYLFVGTFELRWYLLQGFGFGNIQLAGFVDTGAAGTDPSNLFYNPTVTAGPIIRYVTPVGPLSLGYGFPLFHPSAISGAGLVHFAFGYAF